MRGLFAFADTRPALPRWTATSFPRHAQINGTSRVTAIAVQTKEYVVFVHVTAVGAFLSVHLRID